MLYLSGFDVYRSFFFGIRDNHIELKLRNPSNICDSYRVLLLGISMAFYFQSLKYRWKINLSSLKSVYAMWFSNAGLHVTASYESGWLVASYTGTSIIDMLLSISVQE